MVRATVVHIRSHWAEAMGLTDAAVGGGMVTVLMSGTKDLLEVKVDPEMLKNADVEMLQDMIVAAVNEAGRKVDEKLKGQLGAMMPPGMGL